MIYFIRCDFGVIFLKLAYFYSVTTTFFVMTVPLWLNTNR